VEAVDQSLRLLTECDAAQRDLVVPLVPSLLLTADDADNNEEARWIAELIGLKPFAEPRLPGRDGSYTAEVEGGELQLQFLDARGVALDADPYRLDSYVLGATVSPESWEALLADPEQRQALVVHWDDIGPLAHRLDPFGNPLILDISFLDMALPLWDQGPRESLPYLGGMSGVLDHRVQGSALLASKGVRYEATLEGSVGALQVGDALSVQLEWLEASEGPWRVDGVAGELSSDHDGLSGPIELALTNGRDSWLAVLTFDDTLATAEWTCHHGCG
jgi:hypothetical protein